MARIPDRAQMGAPRTTPPPTRMPSTGDLGLGRLAQTLQGVAEAKAKTAEVEADEALRGIEAGWGEAFKPAAETYDGREPGFARGQLATWDVLADGARGGLSPDGQRAFDLMAAERRVQAFEQATGVEANAGGARIRENRAVDEAARSNRAFSGFLVEYEKKKAQALEAVSPDDPSPADSLLATWDADGEALLAGAPDDIKPRLKAELESKRADEWLSLQASDGQLRRAKLMTGAGEQLNLLAGSVVSNPDSYQTAMARVGPALAGLPADLEAQLLPKAEAMVAGSRFDGLLAAGRTGEAKALLDGGSMDRFFDGQDKARLYARIEQGEDASRAEATRDFGNAWEAFLLGADVDPAELAALARASGDAGQMAQVALLKSLPEDQQAALRGMKARAAGLLPGPEAFVLVGPEGTPFAPPVRAPVSSSFGARAAPMAGASRDHNGLDYAVPLGTPVAAASAGEVIAVGSDGASGQFIRVRHPNGMVTGYAHLSDQAVKVGDAVKAGQVIGKSGQSGRATGPHLHFTVSENGKPIDPARLFAGGPKPGSPAFAAWANTQEGFTSDPIEFARGGKGRRALADVPVLVPDGALSADQGARQAWAVALKRRQGLGLSLTRGYAVPGRMLTNPEAKYYGDLIERDPAQGVQLAIAARAALGGEGAVAFMREVGQKADAPVQVHLASLAATGSPFATRAARGLALKAKGERLDKEDISALDVALESRKSALRRLPDVALSARQAAEAAWIADRSAGVDREAQYYVNSALGMTRSEGRFYGGVADVNGANTLLPEWLNADHAEDALAALAADWERLDIGPVYSQSGKPIPARAVAQMRMEPLANGRYRLVTKTGVVVTTRAGTPYDIDLDGGRSFLRGKLGREAVR